MLENMAASRKAVDEVADGLRKYGDSANFRHYRDVGLQNHSPFVPLNLWNRRPPSVS